MTNPNQPYIFGSGGDSSSQHTPVESSDTLKSRQVARIVDAICEGPIVGLMDGLKSVYLNDTQLQNDDGSFNFQNVSVQWRNGTQDQLPMEGFDSVEVETGVNHEVKQAIPITAHLGGGEYDRVRVTISMSALSEQKSNGDLVGSNVSMSIFIQTDGAGFPSTPALTDVFSGKVVSKYPRAYVLNLPPSVNNSWDIKVVRNTADSVSLKVQNSSNFDSVAGLIDAKLSYPNTALVGTTIDAEQFNSIPGRAFRMRGLIMRVPSNYTPANYDKDTKLWTPAVYNGIWDGTFKLAYTTNPAWGWYWLVLSKRAGAGRFITEDNIDKWSLYTIAQYCDEMVPSGIDVHMEPRFTCNIFIQTQEDAYKVIQNYASIFRAISYWGASSLVLTQDAPHDVSAIFTNASVIDGDFNYTGTSLKQRHTVALVGWNDPDDMFAAKTEYVPDHDGIANWGILETQITAFGCTSRGQAHRLGKWVLATERMAAEAMTFKIFLEGCVIYPGAILGTSDILRSQVRLGGRILGATGNSVTLDAPITIMAGQTYMVQLSSSEPVDGEPTSKLIYADITNGPGTYDTVNVLQTFANIPEPNTVFIVAASNALPQLWRVIDVKESGNQNQLEVSVLQHVPELFDYVERDIIFAPRQITPITSKPDAPTNINVVPFRYIVDGVLVGLRATISWASASSNFILSWRKNGGTWQTVTVYSNSYDIDSVETASYDFAVTALSPLGRPSDKATLTTDLAALLDGISVTLPPSDPAYPSDPLGMTLLVPFTGSVLSVGWKTVLGASRYAVQIGTAAAANSPDFHVVRQADVGNTRSFRYTAEDMRADGGPWRDLYVRVTAYGALGAVSATYSELHCVNPQIGELAEVNFSNGVGCVYFNCAKPSDQDFDGIMVYGSETSGFTADVNSLIYIGSSTNLALSTFTDGTAFPTEIPVYFRVGAFDLYGKDNMILSAEFNAQSATLGLHNAIVYAYQRAASRPLGSPGEVEYDFTNNRISTPTLMNNWQKEMPDGTDPLYVTAASPSSQSFTDVIHENEWSDWVILAPGGMSYATYVESSNGNVFKPGQSTTTVLKARTFANGTEITETIAAWRYAWRRASFVPRPPPNDDAAWNDLYKTGYPTISLTLDSVEQRATFFCDISTDN